MLKGIDVAQWQGTIDWAKVSNDGVQFAILKVINKSNATEKSFERNYAEATRHGIPVGVYNYSYATNVAKAVADANAVVKTLSGRPLQMKVWLDVEDAVMTGLGSTLVDIVKSYKLIVEAAGYEFGVYTGLYFYNRYFKPYAGWLDCDFWIARYPSSKPMPFSADPASSKKPSIQHSLWGWQYSSKGIVNGISGSVDLDLYYNDILYYPMYIGWTESIVAALNSLGVNSSYAFRKQIAKANGIILYTGSKAQNIFLLELLKRGKLERP